MISRGRRAGGKANSTKETLASSAVCKMESKPYAAMPLRNIPVRKP